MTTTVKTTTMDDAIRTFKIAISDEALADLSQRLQSVRWPQLSTADGWQQGLPLDWAQSMVAYWRDHYDWRQREAKLNRFDQFMTTIDGLDVHFIHQRSPHQSAIPLIMTHGWPGSIVEFQKIIEPLVDPVRYGGSVEQAFHVICPSLPGFAFSAKPTAIGCGVETIARMWSQLMLRLGYRRYLAQGGDWGSAITRHLAAQDTQHCAAIHITLAMGTKPLKNDQPSADEHRAADAIRRYQLEDSGYAKQQSTRPQTLAYGLADSAVGQMAWILEKFHQWTDCNGDPESIFSRDELLDNVMLYWLTNSAASSARLYWESFGKGEQPNVSSATGVACFPHEIVPPVRRWMAADGFSNIVHWSDMPKGGHFGAFEQPALFVAELRSFLGKLPQSIFQHP